jgi:hypothetical protein
MNINDTSISAINDLKLCGGRDITKDEIISWLIIYESLFTSFESYPESYKDQLIFYKCYTNLRDLFTVIEMEEETARALEEYKEVKVYVVMELLKWLVDFEHLSINFISLSGNTITEESIATGRGEIMNGIDVFYRTEMIQNCIDFDTIYYKHYIPIMEIVNNTSDIDCSEITPLDNNYDEMTSLKNQLKSRGVSF